jgi:hypothetical protein
MDLKSFVKREEKDKGRQKGILVNGKRVYLI